MLCNIVYLTPYTLFASSKYMYILNDASMNSYPSNHAKALGPATYFFKANT